MLIGVFWQYMPVTVSAPFLHCREIRWKSLMVEEYAGQYANICTLLQTDNHARISSLNFYKPDAIPDVPSVLWPCWLGGRKGIRPLKKLWVVRYWRGCLSGARCKWFACGLADTTAIPSSRDCFSKIQNGLPFSCRLTQVILEKRPLNGCSSSSRCSSWHRTNSVKALKAHISTNS